MVRSSLKTGKTELLIATLSAALFIALSFGSFRTFESIGKILYGMEMRLDLPQRGGENRIAIVNIDEKSLNQLGRWPWPRSLLADMIRILKDNGAKLIALDFLFSEPERNQGLQELRELEKTIRLRNADNAMDPWLLDSLTEIKNRLDNDAVLARTIRECGNVILPVLGKFGRYDTEVVVPEDSALKRSVFPFKSASSLLSVNQLTVPFDELARSCEGFGHINLSPNRILEGEVHLLFIDYRGHLVPSLGLHLALDYLDKKTEEILKPGMGIQIRESLIPTTNGEMFIKYKGGRRSFPYYSFVDILNVKKVPAVFENKIVLIGSTAEGAASVNTPVDVEMPRIELLANVVENLMNDRFVKRPESIVFLEIALIVLVSFAGSMLLPRLGWFNRMAAVAGMLFFVFLIGVFFFIALDIWLKTVYIGLSLVTICIATFVRDLIAGARRYDITSKESIETNRMLGLSLQSQGLLDLAFDKFRKCPLDDAMKDLIYNLGLDYERKRMINKAVSVYEYILDNDRDYKDLSDRTPKLKKLVTPFPTGGEGRKGGDILVSDDLGLRPTVGRYEIIGEVGKGAMGIVYKARDPKINRLVAVKTIRFSDEIEAEKIEEVKARFLKEAEMAGKLSHPSIVSIYDVGEDYDLAYMAMEFLEGENLRKFCSRESLLSLRQVLFLITETALALDYAHSMGVIHRDIKPGNIMLLKDGRVKVTDFGIAKAVSSSQTKSGVVLGTPSYMSPEQINGYNLDGRSDIFSLGVVFFELLTGKLPFEGDSIGNLFYHITQRTHLSARKINSRVPKSCEQIIDRLLSKEPEQRFQSAGDLARYVKAVAAKIEQLKSRAA
ncbi:MAG: serine/threonine protein kinase [Deltaproteobacteria bacterium HGW-Deltaproteobacteria-15]|jgi:serine/threonine-protein kinase|nr:MAG: serine/threonine protein kinase [Deltaproteobacteria bacterium HGW-Deltaproteobacteria-15]